MSKNLVNPEKYPTTIEASTGCETMPFSTRISLQKKHVISTNEDVFPRDTQRTHTPFAALHKAAAPSQAAAAPSDAPPAAAAPWFWGC